MIEEILNRRSIRTFQTTPVSSEFVEQVLQAGILAPSSKNRQPWRFVVATGKSKAEMLHAMETGLEREKQTPLLPENKQHLSGAFYTMEIMRQAPVIVFVINPLGEPLDQPLSLEHRINEICNIQSAGAAIENMTLEACRLGLGSLWICDTFFAYPELCRWLKTDGVLIAALALGHAGESPAARPRTPLRNITEWRE